MDLTPPSPTSRFHYGWAVLATSALVVLGSLGLARFGYTMVLPSMQSGLKMDNTQAGMLATTSLVGYLALSVIGGALASRYGPRVVITAGLFLAGTGMLLTSLSKVFFWAAVWQGMTGLGSGASNVPVMGLLAAWFTTRRRGLASGIAVSGASIGLIFIGSFIPRVLTIDNATGWRTSWLIFGGTTIILSLLSGLFLRNHPSEKGIGPLGKDDETHPISLTQPREKIKWGDVYRSITVWHLGLVYTAFGLAYIIYLTFFTKYLITEGGYSQETAGSLFMTMGWFSLLCGIIWGAVSDRIGRKWALMVVYIIHALSFSLFGLWPVSLGFTISAILFGLSAWSIPAIMAAACGDILGSKLAPAALGFITLFFGIGQALGPSIAGMIADRTGSFSQAFLLAGAVSLLGALGAGLLRPVHPAKVQT